MAAVKKLGMHIINFEDLGAGSKLADLVVNAIYPENKKYPNHFFGEKYFILRDEFIFNSATKTIKPTVDTVLITFGGVDPSNLTLLTLESIYEFCLQQNITINIVTGPGYSDFQSIEKFEKANICKNVNNISEYMFNADIIFTSAGRTIYEVASIGTPAIVIAQNERELTHFFASQKYGFINLGLGIHLPTANVLDEFIQIVQSYDERKQNHLLMVKQNLKLGRKKVVELITKSIQKT
jgi:spore coat polysaccharide biosynthesis predicted glycosyltransferase SpsG